MTNDLTSIHAGKSKIVYAVGLLTALFFTGISSLGSLYSWYEAGVLTFPVSLLVLVGLCLLCGLLLWYGDFLERIPVRLFWVGLVVAVLIAKVAWLILIPTQLTSDFLSYFTGARLFASGQGLPPIAMGNLNGWAYSIFLGVVYFIFGPSLVVGKITNLALDILALWLIYQVARLAFNELVARWSAVFYAVWPVQIFFTSVLGTEHLSIVLGLLGTLFFLKGMKGERVIFNMVSCSIFYALGYMTRPAILALLAAAIIAIFFSNFSFKRSMLLSALIVILFAAINTGYSLGLKYFNNGLVPDTGWSIGANLVFGWNFNSNGLWSAEDAQLIASWPKEQVLENSLAVLRQRFSENHPLQILRLAVYKGNFFWASAYYGVYWSAYFRHGREFAFSSRFDPLYDLQFYFQSALLILATIGIFLSLRKQGPVQLFLYLVLLFATLIHVGLVTDSRYQYSFMPYLIMLSGLTPSFAGIKKRLQHFGPRFTGNLMRKAT